MRGRCEDRLPPFGQLRNLQPGRYMLGASFGSMEAAMTTAVVEVGAGLLEHTLALAEPSGAGVVRVRLLGPDGEPSG